MPDVAQIGLDGSQYFDVIGRMQGQLDSLQGKLNNAGRGGGAEHIGEKFLRSERIVSRSAANMVNGFFSAQDAAQGVANALLSIERAGKFGLGLAVGAAVGIAIFEALNKQIEAVRLADEALQKETSKPLGLIAQLDPAGIQKQIDAETAKLEEFEKATGDLSKSGQGAGSLGTRFSQAAVDVLKFGPTSDQGEEQRSTKIATEQARIRAEMEAKLAAETKVVDAMDAELHASARTSQNLKAESEVSARIAALRLAAYEHPNPTLEKEIGLEQRKLELVKEGNARKAAQAFSADNELIRQTDLSNFRGTPEQRIEKGLASGLAAAESKLREANATGELRKEEEATLEVAKARAAIYDHDVERKKQITELGFTTQDTALKVATAQATVGLGPEAAQRLNLQAQDAAAQINVQQAIARVNADKDDLKLREQLVKSIGDETIARANLAKFDKEKRFENAIELKSAKATTQETALSARGDTFGANILKARENTETRILTLLHNQKTALAAEVNETNKIGIAKQLGDRLAETPAETAARQAQEREAARRLAAAEAQINDAANREARGARLDENSDVTKALRAQQAGDRALAQGDKNNKGDFSSVASLAGQDFSSLYSLANQDFKGLQQLAALQFKIAS